MGSILDPGEMRRLRTRNDWSLQYLSNVCGINKAYLSEYENGQRTLPDDQLEGLKGVLTQSAGRTRPELKDENGHFRLILVDSEGNEFRPSVAHVKWTEPDGSSYTMFVGEPD